MRLPKQTRTEIATAKRSGRSWTYFRPLTDRERTIARPCVQCRGNATHIAWSVYVDDAHRETCDRCVRYYDKGDRAPRYRGRAA